jgi:predicted HTH transcriptional regulator
MAFPTTDMAGQAPLRDRVEAALDRAVETANVDFKESAKWSTLKWKIIRTVLGMGNLRDGGLIIIGVSERQHIWQLDGISAVSRNTFDADTMAAAFDKHISPAPRVEAVIHNRDGKEFLVLDVGELQDIPLICKREGAAGEAIEPGSVYHRPLGGVPRTERVRSAEDMRPILEIAAENGARRILEQTRRIGAFGLAVSAPTDDDEFDRELGDL